MYRNFKLNVIPRTKIRIILDNEAKISKTIYTREHVRRIL